MIDYVNNIRMSGLSIYEYIDPSNNDLFIPSDYLEIILRQQLVGLSLAGLPLRTRSKIVKQEVCKALGYPVPNSFKKIQPRFYGQNFDVYTQKSMNVQIWNEDVDLNRRYVFLQVDIYDVIVGVRVIQGNELILLDNTGTFTHKYQAIMKHYGYNICSERESDTVTAWVLSSPNVNLFGVSPIDDPRIGTLLSIADIYHRLLPLVGTSVNYLAAIQERSRGDELHAKVCEHLGYSCFKDDGEYPDIVNQLLEVKLQTSPTIDLGLHSPDDAEPVLSVDNTIFYSGDIRYVIFDGEVIGDQVVLKNLYAVSGVEFTNYFPLSRDGGINKKLQIPLPSNFFSQ